MGRTGVTSWPPGPVSTFLHCTPAPVAGGEGWIPKEGVQCPNCLAAPSFSSLLPFPEVTPRGLPWRERCRPALDAGVDFQEKGA